MLTLCEQIFDSTSLEATLDETDSAILISFYQIFLDHTLSSWRAAEAAASNGQWQVVSAVAHSIKSSSRSIGADALSTAMSNIERITANGDAAVNEVKLASDLVVSTRSAIIDHMAWLKAKVSSKLAATL
jgi:HPt (histidine-containing phosphotransfer) domain-containing protein